MGIRQQITAVFAFLILPAGFPLGDDAIHLTSAGLARTEHVDQFVTEYIQKTLKRGQRSEVVKVRNAVLAEGRRYGFDPLLLMAIIQNESRFNSLAVGAHGEIGLMQLKPRSAEWIARKTGLRWNGALALRDPAYNIRLGTAYLSMLRGTFSSKEDLFLSAYNMGAGRLRQRLDERTTPSIYFKKTIQHYRQICGELLRIQQLKAI